MSKEWVFIGGRMQGKTRDLINNIVNENKQLKQALNEIKEYVKKTDCCTWDNTAHEDILQIIDTVLGGSNNGV